MISIFSGKGHGKSPAALGIALQRACIGEKVVIIQFLKGKGLEDSAFLKRLEPEIKIFRFEKSTEDFSSLSRPDKQEAVLNIKNGMNFARKVLSTGEAELVVLDEVLGLVDEGILTAEELLDLLDQRRENTDVILTGITENPEICRMSDQVSRVTGIQPDIF